MGRGRKNKLITKRGKPYITRRFLVDPAIRPFGVMVHRIDQPDADRFLHDHPWWFFAIVLRGGYTQTRTTWRGRVREANVRHFNYIGRRTFHRIEAVDPNTVTLVISGRSMRRWGYLVPAGAMKSRGWNESVEG